MLASTSTHPYNLNVSHAQGSWIFDIEGRSYLDFIAGIGVNNLGHNIKEINEAVRLQMEKHSHVMVFGEFQQESSSALAHNLRSWLPPQLNCVYPVNSGTEANEAAIKLARRATGRHEIVAFQGAYHGNSMGSMSVSSNEYKKRNFRPLVPGTRFIDLNNSDQLEYITTNTAAVILETVQGDAGVRIPEEDYLNALSERCKETGTLLILDEIQCGYGRTGKFGAFEHYGIVPDILTLGKALGAGLPIGALIANSDLLQKFTSNPELGHISTFAGNPVVCAAANAGLDYLRSNKIIGSVEQKGAHLELLLREIPAIKAIRRKGLMLGVELESPDKVNQCIQRARDNGLILFWFLSTPNAFRISPPLTISMEEIEIGCGMLGRALG